MQTLYSITLKLARPPCLLIVSQGSIQTMISWAQAIPENSRSEASGACHALVANGSIWLIMNGTRSRMQVSWRIHQGTKNSTLQMPALE